MEALDNEALQVAAAPARGLCALSESIATELSAAANSAMYATPAPRVIQDTSILPFDRNGNIIACSYKFVLHTSAGVTCLQPLFLDYDGENQNHVPEAVREQQSNSESSEQWVLQTVSGGLFSISHMARASHNVCGGSFYTGSDGSTIVGWHLTFTHPDNFKHLDPPAVPPAAAFQFVDVDANKTFRIRSTGLLPGTAVGTVFLPPSGAVPEGHHILMLYSPDDTTVVTPARFTLVPGSVSAPEVPVKAPPTHKPNGIPEPPALPDKEHGPPSGENMPLQTDPFLVASTVLPALFMKDLDYPDRYVQLSASPYYEIQRWQFWQQESLQKLAVSIDIEVHTMMSRTIAAAVSSKTDWKVGGELKLTYGIGEFTVTGDYARELGVTSTTEDVYIDEQTEKVKLEVGESPLWYCVYVLVDRYKILRRGGISAGSEVTQWEIVRGKQCFRQDKKEASYYES